MEWVPVIKALSNNVRDRREPTYKGYKIPPIDKKAQILAKISTSSFWKFIWELLMHRKILIQQFIIKVVITLILRKNQFCFGSLRFLYNHLGQDIQYLFLPIFYTHVKSKYSSRRNQRWSQTSHLNLSKTIPKTLKLVNSALCKS